MQATFQQLILKIVPQNDINIMFIFFNCVHEKKKTTKNKTGVTNWEALSNINMKSSILWRYWFGNWPENTACENLQHYDPLW